MKTIRSITGILFCAILILSLNKSGYSQNFYFYAGGSYSFSTSNINGVNLCNGIFSQYNNTYVNSAPFTTPFAFNAYNTSSTESETNYRNGPSSQSYQRINDGFGSGGGFFLSVGYNFNARISAELGFSYLSPYTIQSSQSAQTNEYFTPNDTTVDNQVTNEKITSSARYRFLPALKISFPIAKLTPYVKLGLVIDVGGNVTLSDTYNSTQATTTSGNTTYTTVNDNTGIISSGGIGFGFTGTAGVEYKIQKSFSIYLEANTIDYNWSPTNGDITAFSESQNPTIVISNPKFTYSSSVNTSNNSQPPPTNELYVNNQYSKPTFNYNSVGLSLGIKISLVKRETADTPDFQKTDGDKK
jgi:hypothetical protein